MLMVDHRCPPATNSRWLSMAVVDLFCRRVQWRKEQRARVPVAPDLLWKLKVRRKGKKFAAAAFVESPVCLQPALVAYGDVLAKYGGSECEFSSLDTGWCHRSRIQRQIRYESVVRRRWRGKRVRLSWQDFSLNEAMKQSASLQTYKIGRPRRTSMGKNACLITYTQFVKATSNNDAFSVLTSRDKLKSFTNRLPDYLSLSMQKANGFTRNFVIAGSRIAEVLIWNLVLDILRNARELVDTRHLHMFTRLCHARSDQVSNLFASSLKKTGWRYINSRMRQNLLSSLLDYFRAYGRHRPSPCFLRNFRHRTATPVRFLFPIDQRTQFPYDSEQGDLLRKRWKEESGKRTYIIAMMNLWWTAPDIMRVEPGVNCDIGELRATADDFSRWSLMPGCRIS